MPRDNILDDFIFDIIKEVSGNILDYGCGDGRFIQFCSKKGKKVFGADTYNGIYKSWSKDNVSTLKIENGTIPSPDGMFEAVVSNQVFEHISKADIHLVTDELARVMSTQGFGFHIFPTRWTLVEPHVGLIGAHWFKNGSYLQRLYLSLGYKLGFGYWRGVSKRSKKPTKSREAWVNECVTSLANHCFYISKNMWKKSLSRSAYCENVSYLLLIYVAPPRIQHYLTSLAKLPPLQFAMNKVVSLRLGVIIRTQKN